MKVCLLCIQAKPPSWLKEFERELSSRISLFCDFEIKHLKPTRKGRRQSEDKKAEESESLLAALQPRDFVVAFDEKGKSFDSKNFAATLEKCFASGAGRYVFLIGGAFGLSNELLARSQIRVSLSAMTFNHLLAEAVALEQIYRAFTILHNKPYHNE